VKKKKILIIKTVIITICYHCTDALVIGKFFQVNLIFGSKGGGLPECGILLCLGLRVGSWPYLQILTIQEILAKSKLYRLFCQNASYEEEK